MSASTAQQVVRRAQLYGRSNCLFTTRTLKKDTAWPWWLFVGKIESVEKDPFLNIPDKIIIRILQQNNPNHKNTPF